MTLTKDTPKETWEKRYEQFIIFVTNVKNWIDGRPVWKEYKYVTLANCIQAFISKELELARKDERMKAEVETGLKNFKVTMEELELARREGAREVTDFYEGNVIPNLSKKIIDKVEKELDGLDCGFCNYEKEIKERLATMREKEGK